MISKKELLTILKNARLAEEKLIPILNRHLRSAVFWTGVDKEKIEKMNAILTQLAVESEGHERLTEYLIGRLEKEDKDAF